MKRLLPVFALTAALLVPVSASAQGGLNLSWTDCGSFGLQDRAFACNANTGTNLLFGSFQVPVPFDSLNGIEIVMDLITDLDPLPDWWKIKTTQFPPGSPAGCRDGALSISFDFTASSGNCFDFWNGQALGGVAWFYPPSSSDPLVVFPQATRRARLVGICAVAPDAAGPLGTGIETYGFRLAINNTKTTGSPTCAGCAATACIVFNSLKVTQNVGVNEPRDFVITGAIAGGRDFVTFQGGPGAADCLTVPAKNKTWGQVKNLYR